MFLAVLPDDLMIHSTFSGLNVDAQSPYSYNTNKILLTIELPPKWTFGWLIQSYPPYPSVRCLCSPLNQSRISFGARDLDVFFFRTFNHQNKMFVLMVLLFFLCEDSSPLILVLFCPHILSKSVFFCCQLCCH